MEGREGSFVLMRGGLENGGLAVNIYCIVSCGFVYIKECMSTWFGFSFETNTLFMVKTQEI